MAAYLSSGKVNDSPQVHIPNMYQAIKAYIKKHRVRVLTIQADGHELDFLLKCMEREQSESERFAKAFD